MGCDIHPYVELFSESKWELIEPTHYDRFIPICDKYQLDIDRDYLFFGILAGVRRKHIPPIKRPVGKPSDISDKLYKIWEVGGDYYHSASYYTLTELLEAKEKTSKTNGIIDFKNYKLIKSRGFPEDWRFEYKPANMDLLSANTLITSEQADRILKLSAFLDEKEYLIEATWNQPYREVNPFFWNNIVSDLQKLNENTDHVRMVFWFDN